MIVSEVALSVNVMRPRAPLLLVLRGDERCPSSFCRGAVESSLLVAVVLSLLRVRLGDAAEAPGSLEFEAVLVR